ncbi:ER membrane protein complex subunit 8/9 [Rhodnius prolixus]|uniref:MPN domain-containing protein n=4 Tax=Rhodnius TaxID=13248 RepID=R4G8M7_RHOPR
MAEVCLTPRAYCKIILHAAKYPHCAVNGLLLCDKASKKDAKNKSLVIVDAVPLFHVCLHLSPMAEVALTQVDSLAGHQGMRLAGYYTANETLDDMSIEKPATKIADKIAETYSSAMLVVVDNRRLSLTMEDAALKVMHSVEGKWKVMDPEEYSVERECMDTTAVLLHGHADRGLIDFDNHLDDISNDWTNPHINKAIDSILQQIRNMK